MSAKLDQFFKKYSVDEISKRTKISPISLNYIKNREFDKLNKVKLKGFIRLIEREFKVSLLDDVMKEYEEYYKSKTPKQEELKEEIQENKNIYFKILAVVALIIGGGILYILQKPKQSNTTQSTKPIYQETPINTSKKANKKTNLTDNNLTNTKTTKETKKEKNITPPQIFNLHQKELIKSQQENQPNKQPQTNQNKTTLKQNKIKKETKQKKETENRQIKKNIQKKPNKQTPTQKEKLKPQQEITKITQKQKITQKPIKETIQPQKTKQKNKEVKQPQKTTPKPITQNKPIKIVPLMKTWIKIINLKTNESKFIITDKPLTLPYGDYDIQFGFAKAKIYYNDKVINLNKDLIGEVILKNGKYTIK
ncbi:MAG: hypothetical protein ABGX23_02580 [Nautiliaceae bacterium]